VHLVDSIVRIYHDARSPVLQKHALGLFWEENPIVIIQYGKTENATQSRRDTQNPAKNARSPEGGFLFDFLQLSTLSYLFLCFESLLLQVPYHIGLH